MLSRQGACLLPGPFRPLCCMIPQCYIFAARVSKFDRPVSKQEAVSHVDLERHIPNLQNLENPLPYEQMKVEKIIGAHWGVSARLTLSRSGLYRSTAEMRHRLPAPSAPCSVHSGAVKRPRPATRW